MASYRYFRAVDAIEVDGQATMGRQLTGESEPTCELLHLDGCWRGSDYLQRRAALGEQIAWIELPPPAAHPATERTGPQTWQYFTAAYDGDDAEQPDWFGGESFVQGSADDVQFGRRDTGIDDLNCQLLGRDGRWHDSPLWARKTVIGDDADFTDVTAQKMFDLIVQAQALTPGGRFTQWPNEPHGN